MSRDRTRAPDLLYRNPALKSQGAPPSPATALLGMPGFVVRAQIEEQGEWWLAVETTAEDVAVEQPHQ
jgi:hypothetical protein